MVERFHRMASFVVERDSGSGRSTAAYSVQGGALGAATPSANQATWLADRGSAPVVTVDGAVEKRVLDFVEERTAAVDYSSLGSTREERRAALRAMAARSTS